MVQEVVSSVKKMINEELTAVHTAMPAKVTALDLENGFVDVLPIGSFYNRGQELEYPEVTSVPLVLQANVENKFACVSPIKVGDTVLLITAEQSTSAFLTETEVDQSDERFELQNGIAIPGLQREMVEAQIEANEDEAWILQQDEVKVKVTKDKIEIECGVEVEINREENSVSIKGADQVSITAAESSLVGDLEIEGDLHVSGDIYCGGTLYGGI